MMKYIGLLVVIFSIFSSVKCQTGFCNGTAQDPFKFYNSTQIGALVTNCSTNCVINNATLPLSVCDPPCIQTSLNTSLSCAQCFADFANCTAQPSTCLLQCVVPSSAACQNCGLTSYCYPIYLNCSGYSSILPPQPTTNLCNGTALDPRRLYNTAQIDNLVTQCSSNCVINNGSVPLSVCDPPCLENSLNTSLACAQCFADFANCTAQPSTCLLQCVAPSSAACQDCGRASYCYPTYLSCSGYSNDTPPPSDAGKLIVSLILMGFVLIAKFIL